MAKIGPNQPCPCGSGKKFKKCCGGPNAPRLLPYTQADRVSALEKLQFFEDELYEDEEELAFTDFWGRHADRLRELPPDLHAMSYETYEAWFSFDFEIDDGVHVVDELLEQADLTRGERSFLEALRATTLSVYEVVETSPGVSVTLRDVLDGSTVTVAERAASRTLARSDCLATRVVLRGKSGQPEMELGALPITPLIRAGLIAELEKVLRTLREERPKASTLELRKELAPLIIDAWMVSIFEPPIPKLANTDGEMLVETHVTFQASDAGALRRILDGAESEGLGPSREGRWVWSGSNVKGAPTVLGTLTLREDVLTAETNSVERGVRIRALVERLGAEHVKYRATTHQDTQSTIARELTAATLQGKGPADIGEPKSGLDPTIQEALMADFYATHYRKWVDEPVPALDGKTPREAAKLRTHAERVSRLIRELEGLYESALKEGRPAYDPSWMWTELGLAAESDPGDAPPMAHERVYEGVPGSQEATAAAASQIRARPSFSYSVTTATAHDLEGDLDLQRFLRRGRASDNDTETEGTVAAPYMPAFVDFELHRRKTFWVDAALSFMLESTENDIDGRELRVPFPSFALFFADRHALSLGERFLARREGDPLRGQILRALTVYVTEREAEGTRALLVTFAFDALGADLPSLVRQELSIDDEASMSTLLDAMEPRAVLSPDLRDASPARGLMRLVLNAILYATSADVTIETRKLGAKSLRHRRAPSSTPATSDSVFFLPGKIDIRQVRLLQQVARAPEGGTLLARFMVRGHWRRPSKDWTDQRLRWIAPYWKGPSIATVIERAYRLAAPSGPGA